MKKLKFLLLCAIVSFITSAENPVTESSVTPWGFPKHSVALRHINQNYVSDKYIFENYIQDRLLYVFSEMWGNGCAVSDTLRHNDREYVIISVSNRDAGQDSYSSDAYLCFLDGKKYPRLLQIYAPGGECQTTFHLSGDELEICTVNTGAKHPRILQRIYSLEDGELKSSNIPFSDAEKIGDYEEETVLYGQVRFKDFPVMDSLPDSIGSDFQVSKYKKIFFEDARKNLIQLQNKVNSGNVAHTSQDKVYYGLGRYMVNGNSYFVLLCQTGNNEYEMYLSTMPESGNYPELLMIWSNGRHIVNYKIAEDSVIEVTAVMDRNVSSTYDMRFNLDDRLSLKNVSHTRDGY